MVPVFRYALERWEPDAYEAVLLHRGPLADDDKRVFDWLQKCAADDALHCNLSVRGVDLAGPPDEATKELREKLSPSELPCLVLRYPDAPPMEGKVCWQGRLSAGAAKALVDSPARREVARRILGGESAVWILVESGKREKDEAAARVIEAELKKAALELKLPEGPEEDEGPEGAARKDLRIAFSLLRVSRSDPAEAMLVRMLVSVEPDLEKLSDAPMAFPVFGRGRALFALVGDGIKDENIQEACAFLVGACSCRVKARCPGVDLVMSVDWEGRLTGERLSEPEPPPLVGLSQLAAAAVAAKSGERESVERGAQETNDAPRPTAPATARRLSPVALSALLAVALCLVALAAAALVLWRRARKPSEGDR